MACASFSCLLRVSTCLATSVPLRRCVAGTCGVRGNDIVTPAVAGVAVGMCVVLGVAVADTPGAVAVCATVAGVAGDCVWCDGNVAVGCGCGVEGVPSSARVVLAPSEGALRGGRVGVLLSSGVSELTETDRGVAGALLLTSAVVLLPNPDVLAFRGVLVKDASFPDPGGLPGDTVPRRALSSARWRRWS